MPFVEVNLWPGRDDATKANLIREVTEAVSRTTGASPEVVEVIIREVPKANWGMGGKPFSQTHP